MIRINVYLPKPILDKLKKIAKKKDTSYADLIRRAVEEYLKKEEISSRT